MKIDMDLRSTWPCIQTVVRQALRSHLYNGILGNYPDAESMLIRKQSWSVSEWNDYWSRWYDAATVYTDFYAGDEHKEKFMTGLGDVAESCGIAIYEDEVDEQEKVWVNFDQTRWIERADATNKAVWNAAALAEYIIETGAVGSVAEMAGDTTVEVQVTVKVQPSKSYALVDASVAVRVWSEPAPGSEYAGSGSVCVLTFK